MATVERSFAKTVSYRISAAILTGLVVYFITGNTDFSIAIGGIDLVVKTIWYYSHERMWNLVEWGD